MQQNAEFSLGSMMSILYFFYFALLSDLLYNEQLKGVLETNWGEGQIQF